MSKKLTTDEFISKAMKIHGDRYDCSDAVYVKSDSKIEIICPQHGIFIQTPNNHLAGKGCKKCQGEILASERKYTNSEFICLAHKVHDHKYSYPKLNYINNKCKICILCPSHGMFMQIATDHLRSHGCPICKFEKLSNITQSKGETEFMDYLKIDLCNRHVCIMGYIVDGVENRTILEFLGDYWHGNPEKFDLLKRGPYGKTFGEHYAKTFRRFGHLTGYGYRLCYIWETDWNNFKFGKDSHPKIKIYGID